MSKDWGRKHVAPLGSLDDEARAELLCYFVVGQLVAWTRTGNWLALNHLVELALIWLRSNGLSGDSIEDCEFAFTDTPAIAQKFLGSPDFSHSDKLAQLFADGMRLDYRSPAVMAIYVVCEAAVQEM
jgi:hypothetical protein